MKITNLSTAVAAAAVAAAAILGTAPAAFGDASAVTTSTLGSAAKLNNGDVVQAWTVTDLKPSSDTIPYEVRGKLWEVTATDEAVQGNVTPIVSNFNVRAADGTNYRALFQVATPQGVNPSTIPQGEKASGKIYFDVTGPEPTTVVYNAGGKDLLVWDKPAASTTAPSGTGQSRPATASPPATAAPAAAAAAEAESEAVTDAETEATPAPAAASTAEGGTEATPAGAGSRATDLPAATAAEAETEATATDAETTPVTEETPAAPAPEGTTPVSLGTPAAEGTPAVEGAPAGASAGNVATAVPPAAPAEGAPAEVADPALVPAGVQPTTTVPAPAPTTAPVSHGPAA